MIPYSSFPDYKTRRADILDAAGIVRFEWVGPNAGQALLTSGKWITIDEANTIITALAP